MAKKSVFTRVLAVIGTVLVWFPILAMILTGVVGSVARGKLMMDYLMPAELFPSILIGGALLIWAAVRAKPHAFQSTKKGTPLGERLVWWRGVELKKGSRAH
jgi:hypothetical protein